MEIRFYKEYIEQTVGNNNFNLYNTTNDHLWPSDCAWVENEL